MDILPAPLRPDIVSVPTSPRPTAAPPAESFAEVMAGGARALVQGAQAAVRALPGSPLVAVALRGASGSSGALGFGGSPSMTSSVSVPASPEGPGGTTGAALGVPASPTSSTSTGSTGSEASSDASIEASMAQSQQMNLYYLQVQEQVNAQNRTFTALSNVLEVEHSTAKAAITNIH
jgi:hypothetical protein